MLKCNFIDFNWGYIVSPFASILIKSYTQDDHYSSLKPFLLHSRPKRLSGDIRRLNVVSPSQCAILLQIHHHPTQESLKHCLLKLVTKVDIICQNDMILMETNMILVKFSWYWAAVTTPSITLLHPIKSLLINTWVLRYIVFFDVLSEISDNLSYPALYGCFCHKTLLLHPSLTKTAQNQNLINLYISICYNTYFM